MISVRNLSFRFPYSQTFVLKNISFDWQAGETILLTGSNGSGKSSLLKIISGIIPSYTGGIIEGEVYVNSTSRKDLNLVTQAGNLGIVLQDPLTQVTNITVWEEVVFGPKNLRLPASEVIHRGSISLQTMGLQSLRQQNTTQLSGGQLQRLSIASILSMQPDIVFLDEPIANLDPKGIVSTIEGIEILKQNTKLLVIISHWMDPFLDLVNRIVTLNKGEIVIDCAPAEYWQRNIILDDVKAYFPDNSQKQSNTDYAIRPLTVGKTLFQADGVSFSYPDGPQVLCDLNVKINDNETIILVGANGVGKTTLAKIITGLLKPQGKIVSRITRPALIPQQPSLSFLGNTVLDEITWGMKLSKLEVDFLLETFGLMSLREQSPFQLSGGEQKRLALATAFGMKPDLLILDEPTAGLDQHQVQMLISQLSAFVGSVLIITHDVRLLADSSKRLIVIDEGKIIFDDERKHITPNVVKCLGFDLINPIVKLSIERGITPIAFSKDELGRG